MNNYVKVKVKKYLKVKVNDIRSEGSIYSVIRGIQNGLYLSGLATKTTKGWVKYNNLLKFINKLNNTVDINNSHILQSIIFSFSITPSNRIFIEPLHFAVCNQYDDMLQNENKITSSNFINRTNYFGQTALYLAVNFGFTQIVQKLINLNADPNLHPTNQPSPLRVATDKGYTQIINILTNAGGLI